MQYILINASVEVYKGYALLGLSKQVKNTRHEIQVYVPNFRFWSKTTWETWVKRHYVSSGNRWLSTICSNLTWRPISKIVLVWLSAEDRRLCFCTPFYIRISLNVSCVGVSLIEWCFIPWFCTVRMAIFDRGKPGLMRWILWIIPRYAESIIWTCWPPVQCATTVLRTSPGSISFTFLGLHLHAL